ncbi:anti-phage defense-associated sirtuin Dsr1 [Sulfitobacter sp. MF3-043]|uniref:anti-phage defense-associated sirtuin Dsr1 n=1 Tax=Sulfitobacter sediminivivens TaxID=3252902 RepID=UPI0036D8E9E0
MQFIKNGPDIPEELLEAQEEGRVVFFCGAGISYPAGLPGFGGLVDDIYNALGVSPSAVEKTALDNSQFDTAIGLLERGHPGGRLAVRRALVDILTPNFKRPKATQTHQALLTLSKSRSGQTRLVTTNFDRIFDKVIDEEKLNTLSFAAPLLPVPKNRWDGLVYLHGILPEAATDDDLNRLIMSSGDFGIAYLTERWAARFVGELFRGYTVCFVGYSINDPILRYMMDALAADTLMGEDSPKAFAFGNFSKGKEEDAKKEWEAKNVIPILYKGYRRHYYLHETLHAWAMNYRDGLNGKEALVTKYCQIKPVTTTKQDDFVGRMVWALSDKSGLPAKYFADFNPLPTFDWVGPFMNNQFRHKDLSRFGVQADKKEDPKLAFSLLRRPSPYTRSSFMAPVQAFGLNSRRLDDVMKHLARWLARHVDNPELFHWITDLGANLLPQFEWELKQKLDKDPPSPALQILWALLFSGRIKNRTPHHNLYSWGERLKIQGLTATLQFELRNALAPVVKISRPYRWPDAVNVSDSDQPRVSDLVEWEIVLGMDHSHSAVRSLGEVNQWTEALPLLLPDFSSLLRDALDLMQYLGKASDREDLSFYHQPSISSHEQNKDYNEWTVLIDLTRDAWLAAAELNPEAAMSEAQRWSSARYPLFRRLAFFAAAQNLKLIGEEKALSWLLSDDHYWLWAITTRRETIRLIASLSTRISAIQSDTLQAAICEGPPDQMFRDNLDAGDLQRAKKRMQWLLLAKLNVAGGVLNHNAQALFNQIKDQYSEWKLADDERDEFASWTSDGQEDRIVRQAPRSVDELELWLEEFQSTDHFRESDDWQEICVKDLSLAVDALTALAQRGIWPLGRWRQALQAWAGDEGIALRSWEKLYSTYLSISDSDLKEIAWALAWWLRTVSKSKVEEADCFFGLIGSIFNAYRNDTMEFDAEIISHAINHPVGIATEAAMNWWFDQGLEDDQGLHAEVEPIFIDICRQDVPGLRYGPIILAGSLITLYRVDREWTKANLLPYFDWVQSPDMAPGMWMSFLHSPRLYWPLLDEMKEVLLEIPTHFDSLGEVYRKQYLSFLTYSALEPEGSYSRLDFRNVVKTLTSDSLAVVANTLFRALQGAGEQREEYFHNRISPFFKNIWPKIQEAKTPPVSKAFSLLCAVAGDAFPSALGMLEGWLQPIEDSGLVLHLMSKADFVTSYPAETLQFLSIIIDEADQWLSEDLKHLLQSIRDADAALSQDERFHRLVVLLQQRGHEWP